MKAVSLALVVVAELLALVDWTPHLGVRFVVPLTLVAVSAVVHRSRRAAALSLGLVALGLFGVALDGRVPPVARLSGLAAATLLVLIGAGRPRPSAAR